MVRIQEIKDNPRCIASITVRVRAGRSALKVGNEQRKILGIFHTPVNTETSKHGCPEDS